MKKLFLVMLWLPLAASGQIYTPQWGLFWNGEVCPAGHLFSGTANTPYAWALDKNDGNGPVPFGITDWTNTTTLGTNYNSVSGGTSHSWLLEFTYPYECQGHVYWSNFDNGDVLLMGASLLHYYTLSAHIALSTNDLAGAIRNPYGAIVELDFTTPYSSGSGTLSYQYILEYYDTVNTAQKVKPPQPQPILNTEPPQDFPPITPPGIPKVPFQVETDPLTWVKVIGSDNPSLPRSQWPVLTNFQCDGAGWVDSAVLTTNHYLSCVVTNVH
jgi:hypothetical protein